MGTMPPRNASPYETAVWPFPSGTLVQPIDGMISPAFATGTITKANPVASSAATSERSSILATLLWVTAYMPSSWEPILRAAVATSEKGVAGRERVLPGPRGVDQGGGSLVPREVGAVACTRCAARRSNRGNDLGRREASPA